VERATRRLQALRLSLAEVRDVDVVERVRIVAARVNIQLAVGVVFIGGLLLGAFVVPALSRFSPEVSVPQDQLQAPSATHLFGTDSNGFDIFVRVFYAPRIDLYLSAMGVGLALAAGISLGLVAGFSRGAFGEVIMRVTDVIQAFPVLILALVLVELGGNSLNHVILALAFVETPTFLRLTRSRVLSIRDHRYVEAATVLGNTRRRLVVRHILPNSIGPVVVQAGLALGYGILIVAALAFLGVGVQVPTPEWGSMILVGRNNITTGQWWTIVFPGLFLAIAVAGFNLIAEGIERAREASSR
jgi:peptide/nickel transport system permease protein